MRIRSIAFIALASVLGVMSGAAHADLVTVTAYKCPTGSVGISIGDVTASNGPADYAAQACYGAIYGNDPGPGGQIATDLGTFDFLTKFDIGEGPSGANIGLTAPGASSGSFTFSGPVNFDGNWMLVLKASNCWAGWVFSGGTYTGGDFDIGFRSTASTQACTGDSSNPPGLSHIAIYGNTTGEYTQVPEPGTLALLGVGLIGIGLARRKFAA